MSTRYLFTAASLIVLLSLAGCGAGPTDRTGDQTTIECPASDLAPGEFEVLADLGMGNEGIAFSSAGELFVSTQDPAAVWKIAADGTSTRLADLPGALGLAFLGDTLLVAGLSTHTVYAVDGQGSVREFAAPVSDANFVVATPWATALVSNDFENTIHEVDGRSAPALWSDAVASPNGMGFSADGTRLWAATTFKDPGLYEFPVKDGKAGTPRRVTGFRAIDTPDGLAVGADDTVYVALNLSGKVVRVDPRSGSVEEVATGLATPASLAFGRGAFDPCSLYGTELLGSRVFRLRVGRR